MSVEILEIPEDMRDFVEDFLVEADDLIGALDNDLVALESSPGDLDLLNNIFRAAHTIKGNSSFLALDQVTELTHKMEDVLNHLRKGELTVTTNIMDVLLKSIDHLKELLGDVRRGKLVKRDLLAIEKGLSEISGSLSTPDSDENAGKPSQAQSGAKPEVEPVVLVAQSVNVSPDTIVVSQADGTQSATVLRAEQTVRVGVDRLDSLMNLVGELVLGRNSLLQMNNDMPSTGIDHDMQERVTTVTSQIGFVTTELQNAVMKLRMLPILKVFNKFPRLVRDLASSSKKKIELEVYGQETELDKTVIEEIADPLVHLIRNSCDHGIEPPEERKAAGKPECGKIILRASQEGSNIVVTIQDDGRGLNVLAIKAKALERGLTTVEELERMSNQDILKFIFAAGFSTAKAVSDVSGRGVGMDVVRTNVEKLNGVIELDSKPGEGARVMIKLPLTLAIIQGLLVSAGDDIFIIPLASVHETVRVEHTDVSYVNGAPVIRLRESVLTILPLHNVLKGGEPWNATEGGRSNVVVVGLSEKRLGLIVDRLLGQEEVVIKSLGKLFGNIEGLAGATILGDGRIRLIVDVAGMFSLCRKMSMAN